MADIFISYARADQARIEKLASVFEASGFSVWWDRKIEGGAHFAKDIERELEASRIVVVAWSAASIESAWVLDEAAMGRDSGKLVPLRLDENFAPLGFRQQQAIDLSDWKGAKNHAGIAGLAESIRNRLEHGHKKYSAVSPAAPAGTQSAKRPTFAIAAVILLLAIGGAGWWFMSGSTGPVMAEAAEIDRSKSVAVLPFRDLSPEGNQQWFTDGLAEEITGTLSRTPDIIVTPASSAFEFRDGAASLAEIAERLGVVHILNGSVRRSGEQMRITVELLRPSDGELVWSQTYDRGTDDAIDVQEDIAVQVARALQTVMDPEALAAMADVGTNSVEAYEMFLKGMNQGTFRDTDEVEAHEYFRRAYTIDPEFTGAHLAAAKIMLYRMSFPTFGWDSYERALEFDTIFRQEIEATLRDAEPGSRIQIQALATQDQYYLRFADTERRLAELVERYPNQVDLMQDLSMMQKALGRYDAAKATILAYTAKLGRPTGWSITQLRSLGALDEAVKQAQEELQRGDNGFGLDRALGAFVDAGMETEARQAYEKLAILEYRESVMALNRFMIACQFGHTEEARAALEKMPQNIAAERRGELSRRLSDPKMDRSEPPYVLLYWGYMPSFDTEGLPKTRTVLDASGLPHDQPDPGVPNCTLKE